MKTVIVSVALLFFVLSSFAQKTEKEVVVNVFRSEKKAVIADYLQLNKDDAARFWPVYEKYEQERIASVGNRRIQLLETYSNKYKTLDDASIDKLVIESASIQHQEITIREKYYQIIKKELSTSIAARFYQAEDLISVGTRTQLYNDYPLLEKK